VLTISSEAAGCRDREERMRERMVARRGEADGEEDGFVSSSPYRRVSSGSPTAFEVGGGSDGPKRGFQFGLGFCPTTFPILK